MDLECTSGDTGGAPEGGGCAPPPPPGRAPLPHGAPVAPPTYPLHPYIQKPPEHNLDREFRRRKPL